MMKSIRSGSVTLNCPRSAVLSPCLPPSSDWELGAVSTSRCLRLHPDLLTFSMHLPRLGGLVSSGSDWHVSDDNHPFRRQHRNLGTESTSDPPASVSRVCVCVLHPVVTLEISSCSLVHSAGGEAKRIRGRRGSTTTLRTYRGQGLIHQTYHPRYSPWPEEIEETNLQQQTNVQYRRIASYSQEDVFWNLQQPTRPGYRESHQRLEY